MEKQDILSPHAQETLNQNKSRFYEYADTKVVNDTVVGRLRKRFEFWKTVLKASSFVLNIIKHGYFLPFLSIPPSFCAKNNLSSKKHAVFVEEAINSLLLKGCVKELKYMPYCCNPLTVVEGSKLRLVIDLRHVNKFIKVTKFQYEDLTTLSEMFEQGDFFTKFDLSSGYHHVDIHSEHFKYLGFQWHFSNGVTRYFQFVVLPFGLKPACYVFTKVLRPLVKKWRAEGIRSILYIDDGINGHRSYHEALQAGNTVFHDITMSGFMINVEKSDFQPKQTGEWLGTIIDTRDMTFTIPERKIKKLKLNITSSLRQKLSSAKQISKIAGQVSSMYLAIGPLVRLFTRHMYRLIESRVSWFSPLILDDETLSELHFWNSNIDSFNGYTYKPKPVTTKLIFTDASDSGYGGFICTQLGKQICTGKFSANERGTSSTSRELLAVKYVLSSFSKLLTGQSITVHVDNFSASRILSVGSCKKTFT